MAESRYSTRQSGREDTIVAVSTAPGVGAVAVVRVSGPLAWEVGEKLAADPAKYRAIEPRRSALMTLADRARGHEIDRALVVKYQAPASFTGEDVVEVQCHGGLAVPAAVAGAAIAAGARQAAAGEFTLRAFLNGKLDLAQAEAVDDLVHARGELDRRLALQGLGGSLGGLVGSLRSLLLDLKAELEYGIDFPEEEPLTGLSARLESGLCRVAETVEGLLAGARRNLLIARGVLTVIAGEPNVGKSTLFNRLVGEERSIVTGTPGTTRDAVEMEAMIDGVLFRLVDTAGLREETGEVERIGVEYSRRYLVRADLVVFVHDVTGPVDRAEKSFLAGRDTGSLLRVSNKIDLLQKERKSPEGFIPVSAVEGTGLDELRRAMVEKVLPSAPAGPDGDSFRGPQVASLRQKNLLEDALAILRRVDPGASAEYIAADLQEAAERLSEITGAITDEQVLERIFSRFCVGK
ncbi:MAG: tRNA uridine-5-carboxymethylaminomethyl(34) synthesis GTPase MnmE [Candidatus Glassbacteria bacterium]|nr:tRNA uridine-5-carboxymethylaminomethyl(34) synthesis GTPase MnmE [Candidatus Glassbacteria bacterium]